MAIHFNADEVFEMAERIERNGASFYRRAAEIAGDPDVRRRLIQLAEWEGGHEALFSTIRKGLAGREKETPVWDPNGDAAQYLKEMADRHVFNVHRDLDRILTGTETASQILDIAIGFERDSILFFQGMESIVPPSMGQEKVHSLIQEEIGHVAYLSREKAALKERLG